MAWNGLGQWSSTGAWPVAAWLKYRATLRDSSPPRDDQREPSKTDVSGRQLQDDQ